MIEAHDMHRALLLLDASIDALDAAAAREKKREAGKSLRQITEQQRAETVREFVETMSDKYGVNL